MLLASQQGYIWTTYTRNFPVLFYNLNYTWSLLKHDFVLQNIAKQGANAKYGLSDWSNM